VALGVAGAVASRGRAGLPFAVFCVASVVIPLAAMLVFGNVAYDAAGNARNYWGTFVIPLALALWPASALLLVKAREPARRV
jgi:predicted membrane chloride channel (bestrophin family)